MKVVSDVSELVGNTPMFKLDFPEDGLSVWAKAEYFNPSGSVKDRIAKYMLEQAEKRGDLKPGYKIVEATSGNTGIAFSCMAAAKGYRMIVVMHETASVERKTIIRHYGAEVVLTPAADFVEGAVRKAKELASQPGYWMPAQFENSDNVAAHRETTGKEIIEQTGGKVDAFLNGIGTGGTIMGVAEALRKVNSAVRIIAVDPCGPRPEDVKLPKVLSVIDHKVEGIGDGFVPDIVTLDNIDEWIQVCDDNAIKMANHLARERGLFVGISSGANVYAALQVARRLGKDKTVVTVLPDSADRYYSTSLFSA